MHLRKLSILCAVAVLPACATTLMSDDRLKSNIAGTLGVQPTDVTIESRREQTPNTYTMVRTADGKEYSCVLNGGGILAMGMVNPAQCGPKGEPVNVKAPFGG